MSIFSRSAFNLLTITMGTLLLASCSSGASSQPEPSAQEPEPVDCSVAKCVALTFDDGPGQFTERLLDELHEAQAPATFFVVGKNVGKYPESLKRMVAEGHQIGSHTYDHEDLTKLTAEKIKHEVQWTDEAVEQVAGVTPSILRPPYGSHGAVYDRLIPHPLVLWDVDTLDWQHHDPEKTVKIAMDEVKPGSIVLMHDIHESSVQAVPNLVTKLREAGYTLVTIDQLFAGTGFTAGQSYDRRTLSQQDAASVPVTDAP